MKFKIPTLPELSERIRQHFRSEMPGTDAWLWPNNLYVSAKVFAALVFELFLRLKWLGDQIFVSTASPENVERHGQKYEMALKPAQFTTGTIIVTQANPGAAYDIGDIWQNSAGYQYTVTTAGIVSSLGYAEIAVAAVETGPEKNVIPGAPMTPNDTGLGGLNMAPIVSENGLTGGANIEDIESYRQRIMYRQAYTPAVGSPPDHVRWMHEIAGITRVWVKRATPAPGSLTSYFMMEDTYADGIPLQGDIDDATAYIDALAPGEQQFFIKAPNTLVVDIIATGVKPLTDSVIAAIEAELVETFRSRSDLGAEFSKSWISQAISNATGEERHVLVSPAIDIFPNADEIAVLGTLTLS